LSARQASARSDGTILSRLDGRRNGLPFRLPWLSASSRTHGLSGGRVSISARLSSTEAHEHLQPRRSARPPGYRARAREMEHVCSDLPDDPHRPLLQKDEVYGAIAPTTRPSGQFTEEEVKLVVTLPIRQPWPLRTPAARAGRARQPLRNGPVGPRAARFGNAVVYA